MTCPEPHWGYVVVFGSFLSFFIADGWSYSFGMLYPELIEEFGESKGITAYVPTLLYGLPMILSPLACSTLTKVGCKTLGVFGGFTFFISLLLASLSKSFWTACLSIGVLTSIGLASVYVSAFVAVTYWFDDNSRGLATGIAVAGSGIGSVVFPHLIDFLMDEYLWRGTVLIVAGIAFNAVLSGFLYRPFPLSNKIETIITNNENCEVKKHLLQVVHDIVTGCLPNYNLLQDRVFCIFCAANFLLYLWVSVPYIYIYDWATGEAHVDNVRAAWLLSVIGISRTLGQIIIGLIGDWKGVSSNLLLGLSVVVTGASTLFMPLSLHYLFLLFCCLLFGFSVSATYVLPMLCLGEIIGMQKAVEGFGLLQFVQGIATLVGTPFGGWIYDASNSYDVAFITSGMLIILSGIIICFVPQMMKNCNKPTEMISDPKVLMSDVTNFEKI